MSSSNSKYFQSVLISRGHKQSASCTDNEVGGFDENEKKTRKTLLLVAKKEISVEVAEVSVLSEKKKNIKMGLKVFLTGTTCFQFTHDQL